MCVGMRRGEWGWGPERKKLGNRTRKVQLKIRKNAWADGLT